MDPIVAVVVVNWNTKALLRRCLSGVRERTRYDPYRLVVVDNASDDGSAEMVEDEFQETTLVRMSENTMWAGGNNVGIQYAMETIGADYVVLLSADAVPVSDGWLETFVDTAIDTNAGIVGCQLVNEDGSFQHGIAVQRTNPELTADERSPSKRYVAGPGEFVWGACFLLSAALVDRIGYIDERFKLRFNEVDYMTRAREAGFSIVYEPSIEIQHQEAGSKDKTASRDLNYHQLKSDLRYLLLYGTTRDIAEYLVSVPPRNILGSLVERTSGDSIVQMRLRSEPKLENINCQIIAVAKNVLYLPEIVARRTGWTDYVRSTETGLSSTGNSTN